MELLMRRTSVPVAAAALFTTLLTGFVLPLAAQSPARTAEVSVRSVELSEIGPDSVMATVHISATARVSATLRSVFFDQVTFNGIRVHVPPVAGPIRLRSGEPITGLSDLHAVLSYQELDSLEPLRRAVQDGRARVHAEIRAQLELSLFQKLVLLTGGAWATVPVDQEVTVSIPGGALGRVAALGTLLAAEPLWIAAQNAREWRQNRTALAESVRSTAPGSLVSLKTSYQLRTRDRETARVEVLRLGFLDRSGQVVAPAEVVEPWIFDDTLAEALSRGDVSLDESAFEIEAKPLSGSRTYSLQHRELRVVRTLRASEKAVSPDKHRYPVRFRNNDSNAALLEIADLKKESSGIGLAGDASADEWQPAVVVRLTAPDTEPALWTTRARLVNGRYEIQDPVDASAYGSPVWIKGGAVALLQNESSGSALAGLLKKLE
jgi:hypothetical protein